MRGLRSPNNWEICLAASNASSEARRAVKWERTTGRFSERVRESRLVGMEERERRLWIVDGSDVVSV